jgi:hypothetical protein
MYRFLELIICPEMAGEGRIYNVVNCIFYDVTQEGRERSADFNLFIFM